MLIQRQLRNRIFDDAERLRKKSSELCHTCCNTMSVSLLLINVVQQERKQRPLGMLGTCSIQTIHRRRRHEKPDIYSKCMTHVDPADVLHRFAAILN